MTSRGRPPKLDDEDLRNRFLDQIRAGLGRYAAATAVGIGVETFRKYYKANPDFRQEIEDALDASIEPIMQNLYEDAKAGDLAAIKEWLKHNAPVPRSERGKNDTTVTIVGELDPSTLNSIQELRSALGYDPPTPAELEVYDGEIIEDD